ncbi:TetR/AcrR family transcriptional regulator [Salipaludibacillus agaradhaerens]|uniref:TetR/AcrR family transcriptional regulator n=1 Tax=Salipaludibacillus agaradhaerens TaxID=76935 RepID=A0A9Q4FZ39_SALAG|nr:TetR/AcrR family transcriptional regulator [Salipaludibacillus agaradhaerens]MCR6096379.1 TetR/AcrR family transcriptional regulator [Salipaludibacillus agaradhaerens]MCR6114062.1 TetR/AcrR family transcriptional regulator [Salipaludibacillus agaradhaerens]
MAKEKIKQVAIKHFYKYGYEGVKMSQIAEESGIRKQSLSYHYPSKRELFTDIYSDVIEEEIVFTQQYFKNLSNIPSKDILYRFLKDMKLRAHDKPNSSFLQVVSFSTPLEIESFVSSHYLLYFNSLKTEIRKVFEKELFNYTPDECTVSFLILFDGLIIHLLYNTKQSFEYSLDVAFSIFWNSVQG